MAKVVINDMMDKAFEIGSFAEKILPENNYKGRLDITLFKTNDIDIYSFEWLIGLDITNIKLYTNEMDRVIAEFTNYGKLDNLQKFFINEQDNNAFTESILMVFQKNGI